MPDTLRAWNAGSACPRPPKIRSIIAALWTAAVTTTSATAQVAADVSAAAALFDAGALDRFAGTALALIVGGTFFAAITAVMLLRVRSRAQRAEADARAEILQLKSELDRANALLLSEPQVIAVWTKEDEPEIVGDPGIANSTGSPRRILAFGTWLEPEKAQAMESAMEALRARGESFAMPLTSLTGRQIEAEGRAIGGQAVLRLKDTSGAKRDLVQLTHRHQKLLGQVDTLRSLIEALPSPTWAHDVSGRLVFANPAYARAVDAQDSADAIARGLELLDRSARADLVRAHKSGEWFSARVPVIVAGTRRILDVLDVPTPMGSGGMGIDATEVDTMRHELAHMVEAHRRTLDQLSTAVAIFASDQKLTFYNAAYRGLWELDASFLDQEPTESTVLERLRAERKLPEQADFRVWKAQLQEAYRAPEPKEHWWHLPDGRTLRVVTTPDPEGGLMYLFDDVTERLDLERRYDSLIKVQTETLDNLAEAVAVFASDGRLRLFNPAFAKMWKLSPSTHGDHPHIEAVIEWCRLLHGEDSTWQKLRGAITGMETRETASDRFERSDGIALVWSTVPLPDGGTLVAFQDVTDAANIERALRERNEALEATDELKNDFVHHVSYELRSPLTNIIGFAQLLDDPATGSLSVKQREYLGYITASSGALLAIINDILDLATIDAGAMSLDLGSVDIRKAMQAAAEGVKDRLIEHDIKLDIRAGPKIGSFTADERRLRQILYNLLSNAVGFSPPNETVTLAVERRKDAIVFTVTDRGAGIPPDLQERIFARFETHTTGSRHRGVGLGLSIVHSLVALHGGTVSLDSAVGQGTTVTCTFPLAPAA